MLDKEPHAAECIFRHPMLYFASVHFYESNTIDHPKNTVDAAISIDRLMWAALAHIEDTRPFFDSEHGPIHSFKDKRRILPEPFDDEYFRHMQWAHFASGGAGGGMRWPNRSPHSLTAGMRKAQQALALFLPLIEWQQFRRHNLNKEIIPSDSTFAVFGCGDQEQTVFRLLRINCITKKGLLNREVEALSACAHIPGLKRGRYRVTASDTVMAVMVRDFRRSMIMILSTSSLRINHFGSCIH